MQVATLGAPLENDPFNQSTDRRGVRVALFRFQQSFRQARHLVAVDAGDIGMQDCFGTGGQPGNGRVVSRRISAKVWLTSVSATPRRVTSSIFVLRR